MNRTYTSAPVKPINEEFITKEGYYNTGGHCYVLYVEFIYCNGYITLSADSDSYSIYNCSFDMLQHTLDEGDIMDLEELRTIFQYATYTYDDEPTTIALDLELMGQDYPDETYDYLAYTMYNTIFKHI